MYPLKDAHHHLKNKLRSLNCTIFDPNIFLIFSKSIFFHISPTSPKKSIMGKTSSTSLLKSHTGATQALTGVRESCFVCLKIEFAHYYRFSSAWKIWRSDSRKHASPNSAQTESACAGSLGMAVCLSLLYFL